MKDYPREARNGDLLWGGEVIDTFQEQPVYHARSSSLQSGKELTVCGRDYTRTTIMLPIRHLDKFARPCHKCWAEAVR